MKLRINTQKIISFSIAYMVSFLGLLNCGNAITNALGFHTSLDTALMYGLLWGLTAFVWFYVVRRNRFENDMFFGVLFVASAYLITLLFFPDNTELIISSSYTYADHPILVFFIYSFTGFVAVRCLKDYQDLLRYLTVFSYTIVLVSAIVFFVIKDTFAAQYMTLSYNMLLQVCFLLVFPPDKNKVLNTIVIGVGMFIIVFGGARGALAGLVLTTFLHIFGFGKGWMTTKRVMGISLFLLGLASITLFYDQFILMIVELINGMGFESRNLILFLRSSGDISSGRFDMYTKMLEHMNAFGYGLYGDRLILDGTYAHNLFFEWLMEYGMLLGTIMSIGYIVLLWRTFKNGDNLSKRLLLVFIPNGLVALMFSSSYLAQQPAFYILLGLCVNTVRCRDYGGNTDEDL